MTLVNVPENRTWTQPNTSVLFGNLYATRNIDFSLPGFASLSPRTRYFGREAVSGSDFDYLVSVVFGAFGGTFSGGSATDLYYYVSSDDIFVSPTDLGPFARLTNVSTPTLSTNSDGVSWNGGLWVTTTSNLSSLISGTWANSLYSLTSGIPHPLAVSGELESLLIGNGNLMQRFTEGAAQSTVVTLTDDHRIQWIRVFNQSAWIGTRNMTNGQSAVYQWDMQADNYNNEYLIDCQWVYSGVAWNGNLYIFTSDGRLMTFNGAGFSEVARLPAYTESLISNNYMWASGFSLGNVFQRGMQVIDGLIHVLISSEAEVDGDNEYATNRMGSGIWAFDPNIGLTHKYGLSISSAETDFGQLKLDDGAGAISPIWIDPTVGVEISASVGGTLIFGARLSDTTSSTDYFSVGSVTTGENRGIIQSTRIESPEVQESWRYVWFKFEEFENASDAIVVKYRTKYKEGLPFTTSSVVTWTSTTTFTSTDARFANADAGDEVTVASGRGSGASSHISSISENAGTYTITLEEAITQVANTYTGYVIVDNFHKLSPVISTATIDNVEVGARYAKITIPETTSTDEQPAPSEWLEVKAELRGEGVKISSFAVLSETQTKNII